MWSGLVFELQIEFIARNFSRSPRPNRGGNRQLNADLHSPATDPSTRLSPDPTKDQPTRTSRHSVRDVVIHTETEGPHPYQDHLKCRTITNVPGQHSWGSRAPCRSSS